jgi:predicted TIM-barrel fold metal-dependent hydrolase
MPVPQWKETGGHWEDDHTWLTDEELAKCARAYDAEERELRSPIPTQNVSNGEYLPKPQSNQQKQVQARIEELTNESSRKLGLSRRKFLAGTGGMAAALVAMNDVYGRFFNVGEAELFEPAAFAANSLPDDLFVLDDQLHFVRGSNIGAQTLRALAQGPTSAPSYTSNPFNPTNLPDEANNDPWYPWNPALVGLPITPDAFHIIQFIKDVYLDSRVTVGLISNVTAFVAAQPGGTPMPPTNVDMARFGEILTAAQTAAGRNFINDIAGSRRAMAHGLLYVGTSNLEYIQYQAENHRPDSWKGYCISNAAKPGRTAFGLTGHLDTAADAQMHQWRQDDPEVAYPTYALIAKLYENYKQEVPGFNTICVHKGLAHGLADVPENGRCNDLPQACKDWPQLNFITYHSGIKDTFFDTYAWHAIRAAEAGQPTYQGDFGPVPSLLNGVPNIEWTTEFAQLTGGFNNSFAELGTTFASSIINFPTVTAHILGQLLKYKGARQIVFGSDSVWYGSPQWQLEAFWRFQIPEQIRDKWDYPALTEEAKRRILGLNLARVYGLPVNPQAYGAVPADYASRIPNTLKELLEFPGYSSNMANYTADALSKAKAQYVGLGVEPSNTRYGWVRVHG